MAQWRGSGTGLSKTVPDRGPLSRPGITPVEVGLSRPRAGRQPEVIERRVRGMTVR